MPPVTTTEAPPDTRTDSEKRLTAHVDGWVPAAPADEVEPGEVVTVKEETFPADIPSVLALVKETKAIVPKTKTEGRIKEIKLARLAKHLHAIQQGEKVPVLTPKQHTALSGVQSNNATAIKLEILGREHPEVLELVRERDALAAKLADRAAELDAANATIADLKSQLEKATAAKTKK